MRANTDFLANAIYMTYALLLGEIPCLMIIKFPAVIKNESVKIKYFKYGDPFYIRIVILTCEVRVTNANALFQVGCLATEELLIVVTRPYREFYN